MREIVDIVIEHPEWRSLGLEGLVAAAAEATLAHLGITGPAEISLLATDDRRIADLNSAFRARETATNVLSWPSDELAADTPGAPPHPPVPDMPGAPLFLGDVALAWETCQAEAEAAGRAMSAHVSHLLVHGILHLLGYDHIDDADAALMERLETEILGKLGIDDPYRQV